MWGGECPGRAQRAARRALRTHVREIDVVVPLDVDVAVYLRDLLGREGEAYPREQRRKLCDGEDAVAIRVAHAEGEDSALGDARARRADLGERAADAVERVRQPRVAQRQCGRARGRMRERGRALESKAEARGELVEGDAAVAVSVERAHDLEELRLGEAELELL